MLKTSFFPKLKRIAKKYGKLDTQRDRAELIFELKLSSSCSQLLSIRPLGTLVVVQKPQKKHTTTSMSLGKDLLTHEQTWENSYYSSKYTPDNHSFCERFYLLKSIPPSIFSPQRAYLTTKLRSFWMNGLDSCCWCFPPMFFTNNSHPLKLPSTNHCYVTFQGEIFTVGTLYPFDLANANITSLCSRSLSAFSNLARHSGSANKALRTPARIPKNGISLGVIMMFSSMYDVLKIFRQ